VSVDLDEVRRTLTQPSTADLVDWDQIRQRLLEMFGESTFELWLAALELVAVDSKRTLVVAAPTGIRAWVRTRFARQLSACANRCGRLLRHAEEPELAALEHDEHGPTSPEPGLDTNQKEATSC
jgi:hypothetical protein